MPSGEDHAGWRCAGPLGMRVHALLTELTRWFACNSGKGLGLALGSGRFRCDECGFAAAPKPTGEENERDKANSGRERQS